MRGPVRILELVGNQLVDGLGIGHAEQRFGETHQADTLPGGQAVLPQETFHHGRRVGLPERLDDIGRLVADSLPSGGIERDDVEQLADDLGLAATVLRADASAQRVEPGRRRGVPARCGGGSDRLVSDGHGSGLSVARATG